MGSWSGRRLPNWGGKGGGVGLAGREEEEGVNCSVMGDREECGKGGGVAK